MCGQQVEITVPRGIKAVTAQNLGQGAATVWSWEHRAGSVALGVQSWEHKAGSWEYYRAGSIELGAQSWELGAG